MNRPTPAPVAAAPPTPLTARRVQRGWQTLRGSRVLQTAVAMIVVQLAFRAWATYGAWYHFDDFSFLSRMMNEGASPEVTFEQYSGHIMPAGMYLSWIAGTLDPYSFTLPATFLLLMQVLANAGLLVLLIRLFGLRPGILPPLALYLFSVISVPVATWWAAGVNQLPLQIVLFWALFTHTAYLRTGRARHAWYTVAWMLFGFAFYEKTLLVFGAIVIVTLAYFASGSLEDRLRAVWGRYRTAVLLYVALGVAYLVLYVQVGLTFSPTRASDGNLAEVARFMVTEAYLPGVAGGPLSWSKTDQWAVPDPTGFVVAAAILLTVWVLREIHRARTNSLRAWLLPAFFLSCNILLVLAGRASFVGAQISLDYRYQGEMAAVTAIALGCALMPIRGSVQSPQRRGPSNLLDRPERVALWVAGIGLLSIVSSLQYIGHWNSHAPGEDYFGTLVPQVESAPGRVQIIDTQVPRGIMWGLSYPENLLSRMLQEAEPQPEFVTSSGDELMMVDDLGNIVPAAITPVRANEPGPRLGCGYRVGSYPVTIPLDNWVGFGGWWVRIGYFSDGTSPVRVTTDGVSHDLTVEEGLHALHFEGGANFDSVTISGLAPGVSLCTDEVTVGRAIPSTELAQ